MTGILSALPIAFGRNPTTWSLTSSDTAPGNPTTSSFSLSGSNLIADVTTAAATVRSITSGGRGLKGGRYYFETKVNAGTSTDVTFGITASGNSLTVFGFVPATSYGFSSTGNKYTNNTSAAYGSTWAVGDWIGCAFDAVNGAIYFSVNGTWQNSATAAEIRDGTTTHAAYTGISSSSVFYPMITQNSSNTRMVAQANFGPTFNSTPPAGFIFPAAV